ncbi:ArsR/SmtB family transcription factor [Rhizobium sp. 21-4511-3d]
MLEALSHPSRYQMMCLLREREWRSLSLSAAVGLTPGAGSQHLNILKAVGLVGTRRNSQTIYHFLKAREIVPLLDYLVQLR